MLRLFPEQEANARAFTALTRFLDRLDEIPPGAPRRPALDPLALSFQLKLLWLSGYLPHLRAASSAAPSRGSSASSARRRRGLPRLRAGVVPLSPEGCAAIETAARAPLADAGEAGLTASARAREALAVVTASYEHHGGFRLRTLSA